MCGITGCIDFNKKLTRQQLEKACNTLRHRGPDDTGLALIETTDAIIGLAHQRLSIIDLSSLGHQPMYSDDGSVVIIFNGEIYNFREIKIALEKKGHHFASHSDTEVVVKAYQQYGLECVHEFIGMFAIVIYDATLKKIFLIRDRTGVKPLYYYFEDGCLLFASELKAFHEYPLFKKEISNEAVALFFKYGYIKAPYSIFRNVFKILPGHLLELNLRSHSLTQTQYWNVLQYFNQPVISIGEREAVEELERLCTSAFQYRMLADVPVGLFLSGGYDSSLLAAILQKNTSNKLETFTIGFYNKNFNEAQHAKKVASFLGVNHHEYICTSELAKEIIPTIPFIYDEPFGDSSAIPVIALSRFAKQKVSVALSADGGDELFAGYNRYRQLTQINRVQHYVPAFIKKAAANIIRSVKSFPPKYEIAAELLGENELLATGDLLSMCFANTALQKLLQNKINHEISLNDPGSISGLTFLNTFLAADIKTYLPDDILAKVDRAAMSTALEAREPLLDHRIIEWAAGLPDNLKYNNGEKKYLIKKLVHKYLPDEIMDRPKMGFGIPLREWLKSDLKPIVLQTVNEQTLSNQHVLNKKFVLEQMNAYYDGNGKNDLQIWLVFVFMQWWNKWM